MRLDDKEIMLLWEQGVLRSSRSTPTGSLRFVRVADFFVSWKLDCLPIIFYLYKVLFL